MNPRTGEITAKTNLIGRCKGQNKGMRETSIRRRLAIPSFTDRSIPSYSQATEEAAGEKAALRRGLSEFYPLHKWEELTFYALPTLVDILAGYRG